jgi:ABC-2 type transport system ATP-binding protein
MSAAIEVQQLVKRYGRVTAVDGVTLSVNSGEIVGYLGPNGAGKTTTIRCLLGLLRPSSGSVQLLGARVPAAGCLGFWTMWDTFLASSDSGRS